MSFVRFLSSFLLCFFLSAVAVQAQVVAVVSDQVGNARYQQEGKWLAVGLLDSFPDGTVIALSQDAHSTLSFVKGGRVVRLHGPCQARLTPDGVEVLEGSSAEVRDVAKLEGSAIPRSVNFDQMGGLVRVDEKTAPRVTSASAVRSDTPMLTWTFSGQAEEFTVVVLNAETEEEVFRTELDPKARSAQLADLKAGVEYTVLLSTRFENDAWESEHALRVLRPDEEQRLQQMEESENFSDRVTLLSFYLEKRLWSDALALARELRKERPDDSNLLFIEELLE